MGKLRRGTTREGHAWSSDQTGADVDQGAGGGRSVVRIIDVKTNNRRQGFDVRIKNQTLPFPYARAAPSPHRENRVREVFVDAELGNEAFTYILESGAEGTIHVEQVLEYNEDPTFLRDQLLYELTIEAQNRVKASGLSKREIIRRLGTSASQFYRIMDPTNYKKSVGQLLALLHILDCDVSVVVKSRKKRTA